LEGEEAMATRREANVVYAAGLVQGIVLVTFPAASTIFTDPGEYDLSSTQYGTMFLPQVVTAIVAAVLAGSLARRFGTRRVYLAGLVANLASMALLLLSQMGERLCISQHTVKSQALSVYRKLGVSSRGQAVQRVQQTGLSGM
jgi:MFS family permease